MMASICSASRDTTRPRLPAPIMWYRVEIEPLRDHHLPTHITAPDGYQMPRLTGLIVPRGQSVDGRCADRSRARETATRAKLELEAVGLPKGRPRMTAPAHRQGNDDAACPCSSLAAEGRGRSSPHSSASWRDRWIARSRLEVGARGRRSRWSIDPVNFPWHYVFLDKYALAVVDPCSVSCVLMTAPLFPLMQGS